MYLRMRISQYAVMDAISANDKFKIEKKCLRLLGKMDCRGKRGMEGKKDSGGETKFCRGEKQFCGGEKNSEGKGPNIGGCLRRKKKPDF